jgi:hypothetical protein
MRGTGILNADLKACPAPAYRNFKKWQKVELAVGTRLFKFTGHNLFEGGTTPWWALEAPNAKLHDPGLDAMLAAARASRRPIGEYVRDAYAVMYEWNSLSQVALGMVRVQYGRLIKPVFAFHGQASAVRGKAPPVAYPPKDQQSFPGGAYQLYIPNLSNGELVGDRIDLIGN